MEFPELAKLAFVRVQKVEPDNVGKIVGCILLREPDEEEMVQLAYGPDAALLARIDDAKATLAAIYAHCSAQHLHHQAAHAGYHQLCAHPPLPRHFSSPAAALGFHVQSHSQHYWQQHHDNNSASPTHPPPADVLKPSPPPPPPHQFSPHALLDEAQYALRGQHDDHLDPGYYYAASDDAFHNGNGGGAGGGLPPRAATGRRPSSNGLSSRRPCHYFFKGMCKNGQNCHYSHHQAAYPDGGLGFHGGAGGDEYGGGVTPGSLETLELEITELLHSRRGQPVSIASLPTLYGEKYGKGLQAEGYLTESQRHGKAGYSLTKLLSRLNKIRVIERPHGQHSVVLAEDAARYMEFRGGGERGGAGDVPASSHQIYLTFPAESTFTEDDVADYFGQFGSVRDVRIPCQERRMFGFVSFQSPETVTNILTRRNPHFICGSRVLVKPYREKSKCIDSQRLHEDNVKPMVQYCPPRFFEIDPQVYSDYDVSRLMRKQLAEKRERLIELERRHIAGLKIDSLPPQFAYFDCSIEDATPFNSLTSDTKELSMMDPPLVSPDRLDVVSTSQGPPTQQATNNYEDQESNQIELLPESPFASAAPAGNGVSAII